MKWTESTNIEMRCVCYRTESTSTSDTTPDPQSHAQACNKSININSQHIITALHSPIITVQCAESTNIEMWCVVRTESTSTSDTPDPNQCTGLQQVDQHQITECQHCITLTSPHCEVNRISEHESRHKKLYLPSTWISTLIQLLSALCLLLTKQQNKE